MAGRATNASTRASVMGRASALGDDLTCAPTVDPEGFFSQSLSVVGRFESMASLSRTRAAVSTARARTVPTTPVSVLSRSCGGEARAPSASAETTSAATISPQPRTRFPNSRCHAATTIVNVRNSTGSPICTTTPPYSDVDTCNAGLSISPAKENATLQVRRKPAKLTAHLFPMNAISTRNPSTLRSQSFQSPVSE